jgi:hypothetical protein
MGKVRKAGAAEGAAGDVGDRDQSLAAGHALEQPLDLDGLARTGSPGTARRPEAAR